MATFPTYACILLEGYGEEPDYGVLRTDMDNSIAKQRPRRTLAIVTRDVNIMVRSKADKNSFDTWVKNDINGGTGWFDYYDCLDSTTKQARIVGGKYSWSSPGRIWLAACQLETLG